MTQDERNKVGTAIAFTAQYYGREFKKEVLAMMVGDLEDLAASAVLDALNRYRRDPRSKTFPLPAQIRDMIAPTPNHDAEARELLGRIKTAITQFGWNQGDAARPYIGEVGWQLVTDQGGWFNLCCSDFLTNDSMQAQARNRLIDIVHYGPRLKLVVDSKNQISTEDKIRIEANRQKEEFVNHQMQQIETPRPDPNAEYLSKTPEERKAIIQDLIKDTKKLEAL